MIDGTKSEYATRCEPHDDLGCNLLRRKMGVKKLLDERCNEYLKNIDVGLELKDFDFCADSFPAKKFRRKEGSMVSQILSNHFPQCFLFLPVWYSFPGPFMYMQEKSRR